MSTPLQTLIVDDEQSSAEGLRALLQDMGYPARIAGHGEAALESLAEHPCDPLITDIMMPGMDGLALVRRAKAEYPNLGILIFTGHDSFKLANQALSLGADDFLIKPVDRDQLEIAVNQVLEKKKLKEKIAHLGEFIENRFALKNIIGHSPAMQQVFKNIEVAARGTGNVLIRGESGTGKELVARAIYSSIAADQPKFVSINCCAITESLIESELFGHVRGAFSGAVSDREGLFELAHGGTIFLDEIGDIPASTQMKLLRAIQEKEVRRVGENKTRHVDVRIIAATNKHLEQAVESGQFREDLYYRLNVIPIELPSLRERLEDIPLLAQYFLEKYARSNAPQKISQDAVDALKQYHYPGNVRELENIMQRAMSFATGTVITAADVVPHLPTGRGPVPKTTKAPSTDLRYRDFKQQLTHMEREYLSTHLKKSKAGHRHACPAVLRFECSWTRRS